MNLKIWFGYEHINCKYCIKKVKSHTQLLEFCGWWCLSVDTSGLIESPLNEIIKHCIKYRNWFDPCKPYKS